MPGDHTPVHVQDIEQDCSEDDPEIDKYKAVSEINYPCTLCACFFAFGRSLENHMNTYYSAEMKAAMLVYGESGTPVRVG